jgi:hypothetical protein
MKRYQRLWIVILLGVSATVGDHHASGIVLVENSKPKQERPISTSQEQNWRSQIKSALFVPHPLPALDPKTHGRFEPEKGILAERIT